MIRVRPFTALDLPAVAAMWRHAFRRDGSLPRIQRHFEEVFLSAHHGPRAPRVEGISALCAEDGRGAVKGFIGVLPRRMLYRGELIQAAVSTQLMAEPGSGRAFIAFELLRALFAGPQELTLSDGGNDLSRSVWTRMGGEEARLYGLEWTRVLRPAGYARQLIERRAPSARAGLPISRALDAAALRLPLGRFSPPGRRLTEDKLSAAAVQRLLAEERWPLRPAYDAPTFGWLLGRAAEARAHGQLKARLCRDARGEPVGWYVYYVVPDGTSKVLQIGGRARALGGVLESLLADALDEGSVAITGQADPRCMPLYTRARAALGCHGFDVLVHSRRPEILATIHRGEAFLTRLDGEWWLPFAVDPMTDDALDPGAPSWSDLHPCDAAPSSSSRSPSA